MASFMQLFILNAWGGLILSDLDYVNADFSHDGFVDNLLRL